MGTPITFNSVSYTVPAFGDTGYAQGAGNLSSYLIAIATGTLQQSGGTFSLTADANFGLNFGLLSKYFTSITANPATAGLLRLAKTDAIDWRNNANSANLALTINGSDQLTFNGTTVDVGGVTSITGTAHQVIASASTGAVTLSTPQSIDTTSSPTFAAVTLSSPLTVPNGGTGNTTFTAYSIIAAGTTATGAFQNVSGVGLSGQVLTSNGAAALPTWQNAAGTGTVNSGTAGQLAYYATSTNAVSPLPPLSYTAPILTLNAAASGLTELDVVTTGVNSATIKLTGNSLSNVIFSDSVGSFNIRETNSSGNVILAHAAGGALTLGGTNVDVNAHQIKDMANATASTDAVAFGQIFTGFQAPVLATTGSVATITSNTFTATNLTASISPTSSSHRIKITVSGDLYTGSFQNINAFLSIERGTTNLGGTNGFAGISMFSTLNTDGAVPVAVSYIDSPATTSSTTYTVTVRNTNNSTAVKFPGSCTAVMILEEIV